MWKHFGGCGLQGFARPLVIGACCGAAALVGCERKERVLDVKTPHENVTIDRNIDTGKVEVEATKKK
ncbi:MAG TPA: hypothetical protein VH107_20110 [Lacipirellulaceae bacterium]|jgi:hypothetical protein|nr:hypothetical protein [Lacipirellulaceae bacterium]